MFDLGQYNCKAIYIDDLHQQVWSKEILPVSAAATIHFEVPLVNILIAPFLGYI